MATEMIHEPETRDIAPTKTASAMVETAARREAAEVQAAMVVARNFPRDEMAAQTRILNACRRPALAEEAIYEYTRGGSKVTGPSIRLAEMLAMSWGNMQSGVKEIERRRGESTVMAYAWDLETNYRDEKTFTVRHWRDTKQGGYELKDERDIYELIANAGARRKRACILAVVPRDLPEIAMAECTKTLAGQTKEPVKTRIVSMLDCFKTDFGVTQEMIEKRLGHKADAITEQQLAKLKKTYLAIRDGMTTREAEFDLAPRGSDEAGKKAAQAIHGDHEPKGATPADEKAALEAEAAASEFEQEIREATGNADVLASISSRLGEAKTRLGRHYKRLIDLHAKASKGAK